MIDRKAGTSFVVVLALFVPAGWSQTSGSFRGPQRPPVASMAAAPANFVNAAGVHYKFITIVTPSSPYAVASGVNNGGLVTGYYQDSSSNYHGFVWKSGALRTVDYPGAVNTILGGVNDQGVAIGYYGDGATNHTVTYAVATGAWTALPDIPNYTQNDGYCVNDSGMAIGNAYGSSGTVAWIWDPNTAAYTFFTVPGAAPSSTFPSCINDKDQVAGYYVDANGVYHGFIKEYGTYTTMIDAPGAADTFPDGINNPGILQGQIIDSSGAADGFVAAPGGAFMIVNYPGAAATAIVGINDKGDLCGAYGGTGFAGAAPFLAILQP